MSKKDLKICKFFTGFYKFYITLNTRYFNTFFELSLIQSLSTTVDIPITEYLIAPKGNTK